MQETTISAAGLRVVKLLVGNRPMPVTDLIDGAGVTRTAVTEQLNELITAGFVERTREKLASRGRPRYLYAATPAAQVLLFANNQQVLVPAIWQAIEHVAGAEQTRKIVRRVSRLMAEHYSAKIISKDPKRRLERLIDLLREEGGLLEMSMEDGHLKVYRRSCPFISMVDEKRTVCTVDLDMLALVVGRPVRRTACRHEGSPCCILEIVP